VHDSGSTKVIAVHGWMAAGDLFEPLIDVNTGRIRERAWLERLRDLSVAGTDPRALEGYLAS